MAPPAGCTQLGDVVGKFSSKNPEHAEFGARIDFRNHAAEIGADTAVIQTQHTANDAGRFQRVFGGVALRCGSAPADSKAPAGPGQSL